MSNGNSSAKDRPSVGRTLQQARIDAKLTVDEVSSSTRVRSPIIHAIEQDDFSRCGGDVYARGHVRTLARAVGLDPAELVAQYNAQPGTAPGPSPSGPLFEAERIRPEPRRPNWTAAMVAAIVAMIGFVGFTFFSGGASDPGLVTERDQAMGEEPRDRGTVRNEAAEAVEPADQRSTTPRPDRPDNAVAGVPVDKVTVRVTAKGDESCWVSAKDSTGRMVFEGVLSDGESETFTDDERVDLVLGNAGAVQLHVNGRKIKDTFQRGQIARPSYTVGDPAEG